MAIATTTAPSSSPERVIGFTPLLGGFPSKPLDVHERIVDVENDKGLILISTTKRTLVFGSRLSGWEEFEYTAFPLSRQILYTFTDTFIEPIE